MTNKISIREFNEAGLVEFRDFIRSTRESENFHGMILSFPDDLLISDCWLTDKKFDVYIDLNEQFPDRYELAKYLSEQFSEKFSEDYYHQVGLWAWLAAAYFDQLRNSSLRMRKKKLVATQREEHFIPDEWMPSGQRKLDYRHCVRTPFRLYRMYGERSKFFASKRSVAEMGEAIEQIASDPKVMSSQVLLSMITSMYSRTDGYAEKGVFNYPARRGSKTARSRGFGGIRRLTDDYLPRIKVTFDVDVMQPLEILDICGSEFSDRRKRVQN